MQPTTKIVSEQFWEFGSDQASFEILFRSEERLEVAYSNVYFYDHPLNPHASLKYIDHCLIVLTGLSEFIEESEVDIQDSFIAKQAGIIVWMGGKNLKSCQFEEYKIECRNGFIIVEREPRMSSRIFTKPEQNIEFVKHTFITKNYPSAIVDVRPTSMKMQSYQLIICEPDTGVCLDDKGRKIVGIDADSFFPRFESKAEAVKKRELLLDEIPWCEISIRNLETHEVDKPLRSPHFKEYARQSQQHAQWITAFPLLRMLKRKPVVPLVEIRNNLYSQ